MSETIQTLGIDLASSQDKTAFAIIEWRSSYQNPSLVYQRLRYQQFMLENWVLDKKESAYFGLPRTNCIA